MTPSIKAEDKHILASFLIDAFIPDEFLALLRARTDTESLAYSLSSKLASAEFFMEAVLLLSRHGAINSSLFASLREARPLRKDAISSLEVAILDPGASPAALKAIGPLMKECRADTEVEFRVSMPFEDLTVEKLADLLDTLRNLAHNSDIVVVHLRAGSVLVRIWCRFATFAGLFRANLSELGIEGVDLVRTIASAEPRHSGRSTVQGRGEPVLTELFLSCFNDGPHLMRFLARHDRHHLVSQLPDERGALQDLAIDATDLICRYGISEEILAAMLRSFPGRRDIVLRAAQRSGIVLDAAVSPPTMWSRIVLRHVVIRLVGVLVMVVVAAAITMAVVLGEVPVRAPNALQLVDPEEMERLDQMPELWRAAPKYAYEKTLELELEEAYATLKRSFDEQRDRAVAKLRAELNEQCKIDDEAFSQFVGSAKIAFSPEGNLVVTILENDGALTQDTLICVRRTMRNLGWSGEGSKHEKVEESGGG